MSRLSSTLTQSSFVTQHLALLSTPKPKLSSTWANSRVRTLPQLGQLQRQLLNRPTAIVTCHHALLRTCVLMSSAYSNPKSTELGQCSNYLGDLGGTRWDMEFEVDDNA